MLPPPSTLEGIIGNYSILLRYTYGSEHLVRFSLRQESCWVLQGDLSSNDTMCVFGIIIVASVLHLDITFMLKSAVRGYDSSYHPVYVF